MTKLRRALPLVLGFPLVFAFGSGCTGKYIRPTTNVKVVATPEMLARGSYIVNQNASCGACHTTHGAGTAKDFLEAGESTERYLGGGNYLVIDGVGKLWIPNITPDVETGIGGWTDDEILRAIRDGIKKDGHLMMPMMPFGSYQYMSDADAQAVVAYLRTVPPVKLDKARKETDLGFFANFFIGRGVAHHRPAANVREPDRSNKLKWGEYVMRLGDCWECHSMKGMGPSDIDEKDFMAGTTDPDPILEKAIGKLYMRNLTPDVETGLGRYSAEQIKTALKDGRRLDGKKMAPPMSLFIPHISGLSDEDLDALVAFLKSLKPVKNKVPERALNAEWQARLGG
jgi:mono/diheme cytochrome c family protein